MATLDAQTIDSLGGYLVGQTEKLDPKINMPLQAVTFQRDFDFRTDVSLSNETASFTRNTYGMAGGNGTDGLDNFASKGQTAVGEVSVDTQKIAYPLLPWKARISYDMIDLQVSQLLAQPIDTQKIMATLAAYQLQSDRLAYIGNTSVDSSFTGLFNAPFLTSPVQSSVQWSAGSTTAAQIQADINAQIAAYVSQSATAVAPNRLLVSYEDMSILTQPITTAGSISIKEYIENNNLAKSMGADFKIMATKWSKGRGTGGRTRRVLYNKSPEYLRFSFVPLQRSPLTQDASMFRFDYMGRFGRIETPYLETLFAFDGAA